MYVCSMYRRVTCIKLTFIAGQVGWKAKITREQWHWEANLSVG